MQEITSVHNFTIPEMMKNSIDSETPLPVIQVLPRNESLNHESSENIGQDDLSSSEEKNYQKENNQNKEKSVSYWNSLYSFVILGACLISSSTQTLIPWHNLFTNPEFWWEDLIRAGLIYNLLRIVLPTIREAYCIFGEKEILSFFWHIKFYVAHASESIALRCFEYLMWCVYLQKPYPMPMGAMLSMMLAWYITIFAVLPKLLPRALRSDRLFKKRLKNYLFYLFLWSIIGYQEPIMDNIFTMLTDYQNNGIPVEWMMAFIIPAFRRLVEWLLPKFFNKAVGYKEGWTKIDENESATFCMETMITQSYTIYVAVRLSAADITTGGMILGVEFLINLYSCVQIIQLHQKVDGTDISERSDVWKAEKKSAIVSLLTAEFIEILTPLAYGTSLVIAYYGPNATLMTGIKNEYFGIPAITDILQVFSVLFIMTVIDFLGGVLFGILLAYFCRINIFEEMCKILEKYWVHLAIFLGGDICHVSRFLPRKFKNSLFTYFLNIQSNIYLID